MRSPRIVRLFTRAAGPLFWLVPLTLEWMWLAPVFNRAAPAAAPTERAVYASPQEVPDLFDPMAGWPVSPPEEVQPMPAPLAEPAPAAPAVVASVPLVRVGRVSGSKSSLYCFLDTDSGRLLFSESEDPPLIKLSPDTAHESEIP